MISARPFLRPLIGVLLTGAVLLNAATPAVAQGMPPSIRDTETEKLIRSYTDPILTVAGLHPADVHLYVLTDPTINAFVAEGQNFFINAGLLMELKTPNQVTGVLAHETGHMADGHLVRAQAGMRAAMIPMLLSMAAGIGAMAIGAGDLGAVLMMTGQQLAENQYLAFSRTQEASADQAAVRYLNATGQSGEGLLETFRRFEGEEILSANRQERFATDHPATSDRIASLENLVDASPYHDKKDTAQAQYAFDMVQAKLRGYLWKPDVTLRRYPESDTSRPARYARAMAYLRLPDMNKALAEINSLLAEEPENPYFLEMLGDMKVQMNRVPEAVEPYQKAVHLLPDAPLIHISLGTALLGTENPVYLPLAETELEASLRYEPDNPIAWYGLAQAYSRLGFNGKAELATAERYFAVGGYPQAMQFAVRAQRLLQAGSREWQRASDIMAIAQAQIPRRQ